MKSSIFPLLILAAAIGLAACGNSENRGARAAASASFSLDMSAPSVAKGCSTYRTNCAPCHGLNGKGDGPAAAAMNPKPRNHCNGDYMDKLSNEHIFNVIKMGGATYGYPTMPAQPQLSDEEVRCLVAYIRSLSPTFKAS